jgi:hypothetical protein
MIQFQDNGEGMGKLYDVTGRSVYTGRHIPRERTLFGWRWPPVVTHGGRPYLDAGRFDDGFRVYCEAPAIESWSE